MLFSGRTGDAPKATGGGAPSTAARNFAHHARATPFGLPTVLTTPTSRQPPMLDRVLLDFSELRWLAPGELCG